MKATKIHPWIRIFAPLIVISLLGVLVFITNKFREPAGFAWYAVFWAIFTIYLLSEVFYNISKRLDKNYAWTNNFKKRLLLQLIYTSLAGIVLFVFSFVLMNFYENSMYKLNNTLGMGHIYFATLMAVILSIFINAFQITFLVTFQLQEAKIETEKFKKESIIANLESLKNQIDPHFLFNNFSTLHGLIYEDQEKAGTFLLQLSDVYRSVLGNLEKEKVTILEELQFLKPYTNLLKVRYGENISLDVNIDQKYLNKLVAPFAFQLLVENAIKHNIIDENHKLNIMIYVEQNQDVVVSNNLQIRRSIPESNNIGLNNLKERYRFLSGKEITVKKDRANFSVLLPLI